LKPALKARRLGTDRIWEISKAHLAKTRKEYTMDEAVRLKWQGRWDELKGRIRETWGELTDNDLEKVRGNFEQLVGLIKERTGATAQEIERVLSRE
jgi:uncharacterized protein YjbJ (UPF0337 family)